MESYTPLAQLEFPDNDIANAGQPGQNHHNQADKTDQATNVQNLRYCADLSPIGQHKIPLISEIPEIHVRTPSIFSQKSLP